MRTGGAIQVTRKWRYGDLEVTRCKRSDMDVRRKSEVLGRVVCAATYGERERTGGAIQVKRKWRYGSPEALCKRGDMEVWRYGGMEAWRRVVSAATWWCGGMEI